MHLFAIHNAYDIEELRNKFKPVQVTSDSVRRVVPENIEKMRELFFMIQSGLAAGRDSPYQGVAHSFKPENRFLWQKSFRNYWGLFIFCGV